MDIVANHTAWDSVMMAHPEFYKHDNNGQGRSARSRMDGCCRPELLESETSRVHARHAQTLASRVRLDGFRCDVAYMVPTDFWEQARVELKKIKPDIMFLAEANKPDLLVKAFDVDYSWPLLATLNNVLGARRTRDRSASHMG